MHSWGFLQARFPRSFHGHLDLSQHSYNPLRLVPPYRHLSCPPSILSLQLVQIPPAGSLSDTISAKMAWLVTLFWLIVLVCFYFGGPWNNKDDAELQKEAEEAWEKYKRQLPTVTAATIAIFSLILFSNNC